jgi:hypothetical protein
MVKKKAAMGEEKKKIQRAKGEVEEEQGQKSSLQIHCPRPSPAGCNQCQRAILNAAA